MNKLNGGSKFKIFITICKPMTIQICIHNDFFYNTHYKRIKINKSNSKLTKHVNFPYLKKLYDTKKYKNK